MKNNIELSIINEIESICLKGHSAWKMGDLVKAESNFLQAWNKLPPPQSDYDYSQEIASGLILFYRDTNQFNKALQWMPTLKACYNTTSLEHPELSFLEATIFYCSGNDDQAYRLFHRLYQEFGRRPFQGEDPKYFNFFKNHTDSPLR